MKVVKLDPEYYPGGQWGHYCPACKTGHEIAVDEPLRNGARWTFDGNLDCPSFTPSVNLRWGNKVADPEWAGKGDIGGVCHYFVTAGKIVYCGDCTHALAGQTVDLPDIPETVYFTSQRMARG